MRVKVISDKKQAQIDAINSSPLKVGDVIGVKDKAINSWSKKDSSTTCTIESLDNGISVFEGSARDRKKHTKLVIITKDDIVARQTFYVGANPFEDRWDNIRSVAFGLDSILFNLDIVGERSGGLKKPYDIGGIIVNEANWNPFIYNGNGEKQYYQRPFVWSTKDKQLLVESIYQGIDCGKILVRLRGFDELRAMAKNGETELAFRDIVDGKQRLNAVRAFLEGEFPDLDGNYFGDLSNYAQNKFTNHQLFSYAEMPEGTKDADVIKQFLKLNFAGVPQSEEHINFVKDIQKSM